MPLSAAHPSSLVASHLLGKHASATRVTKGAKRRTVSSVKETRLSATPTGSGQTMTLLKPGNELPSTPPPTNERRPGPLTEEEVAEFFSAGCVVVRGLLSGEQLDAARRASINSKAIPMAAYESLAFDAWRTHEHPFLEIATRSALVEAAAQLTPSSSEQGLHVLKDAFFKSKGGNKGCDWHVDDPFFWPAVQQSPGPGVNIWVALDPISEEGGGGLAIAPGSHGEEYLGARAAIRQNTCAMAQLSPEWHSR